jgi:hypothetical protein
MKLKLFNKKQPEPYGPTTLHTPTPTVDVPKFSIQYKDSKPEHIIFSPKWLSSECVYFTDYDGIRIFNHLRDHYPELKSWRSLPDYTLSTYRNISDSVVSLDEVIELVAATQIVITYMLDDWLYYKDMIVAHSTGLSQDQQ